MVKYKLEEQESGSNGGKRRTRVHERSRSPRMNERSREGFDLVSIA